MSGAAPPAGGLSGALDTVALADVLQLLELGRKTGVLAVDGGDGRRGLVRLADGAVAAARFRDAAGRAPATADITDAVGALLALPAGRFAFAPADAPAPPGPRVRVEAVLMAAFHRADERARADASPGPDAAEVAPADVPGAARVPTLAPARPDAPVPALRARHWAVLAAIDGVRDAAALAAACRLAPAAAARVLAELAAAGLVTYPGAGAGSVAQAPARSSGC